MAVGPSELAPDRPRLWSCEDRLRGPPCLSIVLGVFGLYIPLATDTFFLVLLVFIFGCGIDLIWSSNDPLAFYVGY